MKKWNILSRIDSIKLKRPGQILVFETTGFELYGRIARAGLSARVRLGEPALSRATDFSRAVKEVLEQLKGQTRFMPRTAVLITPSAAGDLLSLPVDPQKPRPKLQMGEMVRWELEELFVRLGDIWSLGAILQGRGYIDGSQRRSAEEIDPGPIGAGGVFGEMVSPDKIEECLELQETLMAMDDDLITGWAPQGGADAPFIWFGAGIGQGIREKWAHAFQKNGIFLAWIYPQIGAALPMVKPEEEGWLLLDIRQEQIGLFQGRKEVLESFSLAPFQADQTNPAGLAQAVVRFIHPKTREVFISGPEALFVPLTMEIKQALNRPEIKVRRVLDPGAAGREITETPDNLDIQEREDLSPDIPEGLDFLGNESAQATELPPQVAASMEGAARHALRRCRPQRAVRIEARDPRPPLWKNKALWPWAGIFLLGVGMAGNFIYMRHETEKKQWELDLLDIEYERRLKIKEEARSTNTEANLLMGRLKEKEAELEERNKLKEILDKVIRYRQDLVPGVLSAVGNAVSEEVVIDLLEEDPDRAGFYMEAWALRDTEGHRFGKTLNEVLEPWGYKVDNLQVTAGKGRMDLEGYILKIRVVKKRQGKGREKMIDRWRKMTPGEKLRAQIVIAFLMLGIYGLVFYPLARKKLDYAEKMLHRRQDRIEKRADISHIGDKGLNPKVIEKKIEDLDRELAAMTEDFNELDTGFAPLESSEVRQQLMLEISTLAARTSVNLISVAQKGVSLQEDSSSPTVDPFLKRPLLLVRAKSGFWNLVDFFNGLKDLSFHVSVMNLKLYSEPPRGFAGAGEEERKSGLLYVFLEMSI